MPNHGKDYAITQMLSQDITFPTTGPTLVMSDEERWQHHWKNVKCESFTKEDWLDLHATIEAFKGRVVRRHRHAAFPPPPQPASGQKTP